MTLEQLLAQLNVTVTSNEEITDNTTVWVCQNDRTWEADVQDVEYRDGYIFLRLTT